MKHFVYFTKNMAGIFVKGLIRLFRTNSIRRLAARCFLVLSAVSVVLLLFCSLLFSCRMKRQVFRYIQNTLNLYNDSVSQDLSDAVLFLTDNCFKNTDISSLNTARELTDECLYTVRIKTLLSTNTFPNIGGLFIYSEPKDIFIPQINGAWDVTQNNQKGAQLISCRLDFCSYYMMVLIPSRVISQSLRPLHTVLVFIVVWLLVFGEVTLLVMHHFTNAPSDILQPVMASMRSGEFGMKIEMRSQLQNLKAQVELHFLINCLNTIFVLSQERGGQDITQEVIRTLSEHLRFPDTLTYEMDLEGEQRIHLIHVDSGTGFDEKTLERLNHMEDHPEFGRSGYGIGLYNMVRRLKLTMGETAEIRFSNEEGMGARIDMDIPFRLYAPEKDEDGQDQAEQY